ncbi:hypothetical protein [Pontiella sp.]
MKNKMGLLVMVMLVVAVSVAHARSRRTVTVVEETIVSPLDGYAGQVQ